MTRKRYSTKLFWKYYLQWIRLYKEHAVRPITLNKYYLVQRKLRTLAPDLHLNELDRRSYQRLLNTYAATHERKTVLDFHHHLKAGIIDAVDDGLLEFDPTRRVIIKGRKATPKKTKFLSLFELQRLLQYLKLGTAPDWDWFILLVAKRLGHANTTTTQQTYLHIIQELENKDNDKVLQHLSKLI